MSEKLNSQPEENPNQNPDEQDSEQPKNEKYEARKKRSIDTASENTEMFMKWAEEQGYDWNDEAFMRGVGKMFLKDMNKLFGKEYGLSVAEEDLPEIAVYDKGNACYVPWYMTKDSDQKKPLNVIFIGRINEILNGNTMGEELAHFYRCHLDPKSDEEAITSEFFGFLGKRLWEKATQKSLGSLDLLKTDAEHVIEPKENFIKSHKAVKRGKETYLEGLKKFMDEAPNNNIRQFWQEALDDGEQEFNKLRKDAVAHQRGYEMASKIDIDKITDWQKLFSMPNTEG